MSRSECWAEGECFNLFRWTWKSTSFTRRFMVSLTKVFKNHNWHFLKTNPFTFWKSIQFSFKNCESARLGSSLFLNDSFSQSDFRKRLTVVNKEKLLVENFYTEDFYQDTFSLRRFWVIEIPIRVLIASFFHSKGPFFKLLPVHKKMNSVHQIEDQSKIFLQYLIENWLLNSLSHIHQAVCLWLIALLNILKSIEKHLNLN